MFVKWPRCSLLSLRQRNWIWKCRIFWTRPSKMETTCHLRRGTIMETFISADHKTLYKSRRCWSVQLQTPWLKISRTNLKKTRPTHEDCYAFYGRTGKKWQDCKVRVNGNLTSKINQKTNSPTCMILAIWI